MNVNKLENKINNINKNSNKNDRIINKINNVINKINNKANTNIPTVRNINPNKFPKKLMEPIGILDPEGKENNPLTGESYKNIYF